MQKEELNLEHYRERFDIELREKKFELAYKTLKKMPHAQTPELELKRLVFLVENYRKFIDAFKEHSESCMKEYASLGSISRIKVRNFLLAKYKSLGTLEELGSKMQALSSLTGNNSKL